jgi:hypothetical protein
MYSEKQLYCSVSSSSGLLSALANAPDVIPTPVPYKVRKHEACPIPCRVDRIRIESEIQTPIPQHSSSIPTRYPCLPLRLVYIRQGHAGVYMYEHRPCRYVYIEPFHHHLIRLHQITFRRMASRIALIIDSDSSPCCCILQNVPARESWIRHPGHMQMPCFYVLLPDMIQF